jgi:hypothetical protein
MIFPDSKKVATVIIGRMNKEGKSEGGAPVKPEFQSDDSLTGLHSASEDMVSAMKEGSPAKYMDALRSFIDQHHTLVNSPMSQTPQRVRQEEEDAGQYEYP